VTAVKGLSASLTAVNPNTLVQRLANNHVTWVRRYVAGELPPPHSPENLAGKPITWTIGALNPAGMFVDDVVLAVKLLNCNHFPQVSAPVMLAQHIRASTVPH
jgi:hypothetical protein